MVAKSIIKLIDEAIIPALALILGKMLGLFSVSYLFQLPFTFKMNEALKILPTLQFQNAQDYIMAENYSNLAMFLVAAAGTVFIIMKAHFFHESHIHPRIHQKLIALNLENLVAPNYHLYHQAAIWLMYLWLTTFFVLLSTFMKITSPYIAIIAFVIAGNLSWIFALDIEKEVELSKQ